jgi:hypothetical protein
LADSKFRAIVLGTTLGNRHDHRLVIGRTGHSAYAVETRWQTVRNLGLQQSVSVASIIDTFEENKVVGVGRSSGC